MIRIACETYAWEMAGGPSRFPLDHIVSTVSRSGFTGIEPVTGFLGRWEDPNLLKELLEAHNLQLAVLCQVEDWLHPRETELEKRNANQWIDLLQYFPETIYLLVQMPGSNRKQLRERQQNLLSCVNSIAQRAASRGIQCSYHPNSPAGSVFRTEEDYGILLDGLNANYIGFTPDVGHIAKGGMDPLKIIRRYRERVNLIHYKDMFRDGRWAPTGMGVIDFESITKYLVESNYQGWIIMEDECDRAIGDPDGVTLDDGKYIDQYIKPLLSAK